MAYATYTTRAVVCGSKDSYTSDRSYLLFTEEAGMLWGSARSVRVEKSKQRQALQDFSTLRVSLVKGKTGWKIGSAEALGNPFLAAKSREERTLVTYLVRQLRRYLQGEEPVRPLFADVWEVFLDLPAAEEIERVQAIFNLRMLNTLGYASVTPSLRLLVEAKNLATARSLYEDSMSGSIEKITKVGETVSHL